MSSSPDQSRQMLPQTAEELLPLVYAELRKLAASRMKSELSGQTLQPTALVHEAYLRLGGESRWNHRGHFFGAAAEAMRRILIENARTKATVRHGGGLKRINLETESINLAWETDPAHLLDIEDAITRLEAADAQAAELVRLRFFVGLPNDEAAEMLGFSASTGKRLWAYARAFLYRELRD
jgi:RNA polymerase sigma factor (TIGR02999 family)